MLKRPIALLYHLISLLHVRKMKKIIHKTNIKQLSVGEQIMLQDSLIKRSKKLRSSYHKYAKYAKKW